MAVKGEGEVRVVAITVMVLVVTVILAGFFHDIGLSGLSTSCGALAVICLLVLSGFAGPDKPTTG